MKSTTMDGLEFGHGNGPCANLACWPVIIYIIFAIILLIGILFSCRMDQTAKAWAFFVTLIWTLIWAAILWFFCRSGQHTVAWFLLLLPLAIGLFWCISSFLATATTSAECVGGGSRM